MKEAELRVKLEKHYSNEGYDKLWGSKDNGPGADFIFYKKNISRILVVETKGENPSQIGGLADIQKALGQIVEHMDNPRGTNIGVLELYAKAGATLTYAIALPCTQRYLDWCSDRVSRPTRKKLDLHWIFVDYTGQVHSVDPEHSIVEIIPLKG